MLDTALLLIGILVAAAGGELFVRGAVGLAGALRVPPGIVGATIAAFATSSPEFTVSTFAALEGRPQIGLGDALGSNVVNIALVLGAALCISGIATSRYAVRRDFPVAAAAPLITGLLVYDGELSQADGLLLFGGFLAWAAVTYQAAATLRRNTPVAVAPNWRPPILQSLSGLLLLLLAGRLIVDGASGIASSFGIDAYVIGATVVAAGTSAPELATAIIAKLRGHDDLSLGTILGSNIFNGLAIVSVAATISPISVDAVPVAATLATGLAALAVIYPPQTGWLGRGRGALLILIYLVHVGLAYADA